MLYSEWLDQDLVGWIQVNLLPQSLAWLLGYDAHHSLFFFVQYWHHHIETRKIQYFYEFEFQNFKFLLIIKLFYYNKNVTFSFSFLSMVDRYRASVQDCLCSLRGLWLESRCGCKTFFKASFIQFSYLQTIWEEAWALVKDDAEEYEAPHSHSISKMTSEGSLALQTLNCVVDSNIE